MLGARVASLCIVAIGRPTPAHDRPISVVPCRRGGGVPRRVARSRRRERRALALPRDGRGPSRRDDRAATPPPSRDGRTRDTRVAARRGGLLPWPYGAHDRGWRVVCRARAAAVCVASHLLPAVVVGLVGARPSCWSGGRCVCASVDSGIRLLLLGTRARGGVVRASDRGESEEDSAMRYDLLLLFSDPSLRSSSARRASRRSCSRTRCTSSRSRSSPSSSSPTGPPRYWSQCDKS